MTVNTDIDSSTTDFDITGSDVTQDAAAECDSDADYASESQQRPHEDHEGRAKRSRLHRLQRLSPPGQALASGLALIAALCTIGAWLGWSEYQHRAAEHVRAQLLLGGRQGALNLTTIDWQRIDNDTQRILASSTGEFYDEFAQRLKPFSEVVKQAQSKSEGTVTAASLESSSGNQGRVLLAVNVKISNAGVSEDTPRVWRMRISVQKIGDDVKMSNVEFIP